MDTESIMKVHDAVPVQDDAATKTPAPHTTASSTSMAVPAGDGTSSSNAPMWQQEKQGSKCCGCCCDYRMAVIILSIIRLLYLTFQCIMSLSLSFEVRIMIVYACMSIVSLVGAKYYSICLIGIDLVWCVGKYYTSYD